MTDQAMARKAALSSELERVVGVLRDAYAPQLVYVFGSVAHGDVSEWSDVDMVIVKETDKRFLDRIAEVLDLVVPRLGMDVVVYTPAEWAALSRQRRFVREEVLGKGKLLYAA